MNLSYAKFWTSMLTDEWFVSLNCAERGFWMQLILIAKAWGDTGVITTRSGAAIGQATGLDGKTARKFLGKFLENARLEVVEQTGKFLTIKIVNYQYWQQFSIKKDGKNGLEKPTGGREISPIIVDRDITETDRSANAGRPEFQEVIDYYNLKTKRNWSLTDDRKRMLRLRLKRFTVDQLKDAIDGITSRPHNLGQNQTNTVYLDFELIFRNDAQVDKYRQDRVAKKTTTVKEWQPEIVTPEQSQAAETARQEAMKKLREQGVLR